MSQASTELRTKPKPAPFGIGRTRAILNCKCPACRKGDMFLHSTFKFNGFAKMYDECPHCGQDFRVEPGFYMSASYIGYVFYVGLILTLTFSSFYFFPELNDIVLILSIIGIILVVIPLNFRLARAVSLHFLGSIKYDPQRRFAENSFFVSGEGALRRGNPLLSGNDWELEE